MLSISLTSLSLYAQDLKIDVDVRQDPETKEYIFKPDAFAEIWAYILFLERREIDLEKSVEEYKKSAIKAQKIAFDTLILSTEVISDSAQKDKRINELITINNDLSTRYTTMEVVIITSVAGVLGVGIGFMVGVVAK